MGNALIVTALLHHPVERSRRISFCYRTFPCCISNTYVDTQEDATVYL